MKRYFMFLGRKNQYCENDYTTKCNLQIFNVIPINLPIAFFTELKQKISQPTLSDPMDCSLPGSAIHGIFQARVLEWGATAFSDMET